MNRITHLRGPRVVAAMALTCVTVLIALLLLSLAPSGLVRTANAEPPEPEANTQIAELYMLQSDYHEALSFNVNPGVAAQHLDLMGQLFADNATLTVVDTGAHFQGRAAIVAFFANGASFHKDLVSLAPSFRTRLEQDGNTANVYFECHSVNPATDVMVGHRYLTGTAKKVRGQWVFQDVELGPATL